MTDKNPKESSLAASVKFAGAAAEIGVKAYLEANHPGAGALIDMGKLTVSSIAGWVRSHNERKIKEFYNEFIREDDLNVPTLKKQEISELDFYAILAACINDIEEEKTLLYATLARSLGLRRVSNAEKRFFIVALKDLDLGDIERMRRSYIASKYELIPVQGPIYDASIARDSAGSHRNYGYERLVQRGFLEGHNLSQLGVRFVLACYQEQNLTPASIRERAFEPMRTFTTAYDLSSPSFQDFHRTFSSLERAAGIRSLGTGTIQKRAGQLNLPLATTHVILIAGNATKSSRIDIDALQEVTQRKKTIGLVLPGADFSWFESLRLIDVLRLDKIDTASIKAAVERIKILGLRDRANEQAQRPPIRGGSQV